MIHAFTARTGIDGLGDYYGSYPTEGDAFRALTQDYTADWFTLMTDADVIKPGHLVRIARGALPLLHGGDGLYAYILAGNRSEFTRVASMFGFGGVE